MALIMGKAPRLLGEKVAADSEKRKAEHMACPKCGYADGGEVDGDVVGRILGKMTADEEPNNFDEMEKEPAPHADYTGANSGDELGDDEEDEGRKDIVSRITRSFAKRDRMPRPA